MTFKGVASRDIINRKNLEAWRRSLRIMEKYSNCNDCLLASAEHDQVWSFLGTDDCPEDSEDGQKLINLGWFVDEDCYSMFV